MPQASKATKATVQYLAIDLYYMHIWRRSNYLGWRKETATGGNKERERGAGDSADEWSEKFISNTHRLKNPNNLIKKIITVRFCSPLISSVLILVGSSLYERIK